MAIVAFQLDFANGFANVVGGSWALEVDESLCPGVIDWKGILDSNNEEFAFLTAMILGKVHYTTCVVVHLNLENPPAETLLVYLEHK